jgi:hypothetical protein
MFQGISSINYGFWRLPDDYHKFIAFACYPPRSETSHNGGLVGLYEPQKLCVLLFIMLVIVMQLISVHVVDICSIS